MTIQTQRIFGCCFFSIFAHHKLSSDFVFHQGTNLNDIMACNTQILKFRTFLNCSMTIVPRDAFEILFVLNLSQILNFSKNGNV